jgi:hypothetical protein
LTASPLPPFRVEPMSSAFRSGVDVFRLNQLNDQLEAEDFRREIAVTAQRGSGR